MWHSVCFEYHIQKIFNHVSRFTQYAFMMKSQPLILQKQMTVNTIVLGCFLLSGVSGLIYEILWTRQLILVFGSTSFAVSTVLTAFMGGLALGSFLFGRYISRNSTASTLNPSIPLPCKNRVFALHEGRSG